MYVLSFAFIQIFLPCLNEFGILLTLFVHKIIF